MGLFGVELEQEEVPEGKKYMISTRENSEYKWQNDPHVIGALEVPSQPDLKVHDHYSSRCVNGKEEAFDDAMEVWEDWKLKEEFVKACDNVPVATCCCGLIQNDDKTIKNLVPSLNNGWIKATNQKLAGENMGFKLDVFIWTWHNAVGKAETNILLIRFFKTKTTK